VAIASQALANGLGMKNGLVGRLLELSDGHQVTVIGIARDMKSEQYGIPDGPRIYLPRQRGDLGMNMAVRFHGQENDAVRDLEQAVQGVMVGKTVVPIPVRSVIDDKASKIRALSEIILLMAAIGTSLSMLGVYGILSFAFTQRRREFGLRVALGATKLQLFRRVFGSGMRQLIAGLGVGMVLALPCAFALFRVSHDTPVRLNIFDLGSYTLAAAVVGIVACSAMLTPALRATKVEPAQILRDE
jgi:predicted lysophospholipase L1 biosynthesis ABC-type transport system permease subunit